MRRLGHREVKSPTAHPPPPPRPSSSPLLNSCCRSGSVVHPGCAGSQRRSGRLPHWAGGGPEAQRAAVTSPGPHSQEVADPGWKQVCAASASSYLQWLQSLSAKPELGDWVSFLFISFHFICCLFFCYWLTLCPHTPSNAHVCIYFEANPRCPIIQPHVPG